MASGQIHRWLHDAVTRSGSARSLYAQETTLSRRGLLTRADRRARELEAAGIRAGDVVALAIGNVSELAVLLLATSKLHAIALLVDASAGDQPLLDALRRIPVRAVVRRPRGPESPRPPYPEDHTLRSSKRLGGSLLGLDVLEPPVTAAAIGVPPDTETLTEVRGIGGVLRWIARSGDDLAWAGRCATDALKLSGGTRIVCAGPLTAPRFFDTALVGWLASEAQLIMAEGRDIDAALAAGQGADQVVVIDTLRRFIDLSRALQATASRLSIQPVILQAAVPWQAGADIADRFGCSPLQLLVLEELGLLASREMTKGGVFCPVAGIDLRAGAAMHVGGQEILARVPSVPTIVPSPEADEPGTIADDDGFVHTGYAARFARNGEAREVVGRDDGLVDLEGRRACLDNVEEIMLHHRRLTWVRAVLEHTSDGDSHIGLEYRATGETALDDLEEYAVGSLPAYMVPRTFRRLPD